MTRITIEIQDDGLFAVTAGRERHVVMEAHFGLEGQIPFMDLRHPLVALEGQVRPSPTRCMDDPPDE